jgi:hypothetical protein
MKLKPKLYVVRKYIKALTAADAIRKERKASVEEVLVDDEWRKNQTDSLAGSMGFQPKK